MSTIQMLRALVHQRLTAAVDEILELFERAITDYEGELSCLQHKNVGLCRGTRAVLNPEVRLHRTDVQQLSLQQERSPSLDQEEPQPLHVKEEQGGLGQKGEQQLQGLEEADDDDDATKLSCSLVLVKMENDEDKTLYQGCSSSTGLTNTETRNFDPGRLSQPVRDDDEASDWSESGAEVKESDWKDAAKAQSENNDICLSAVDIKTGKKSYSCSQCGATYTYEGYLKRHMRIHTEKKMFNCSVCLKSFNQSGNLKKHMRIHRDVKPYVCSFCGKKWYQSDDLKKHTRIHTGEKPYVCSLCGKTFTVSSNLKVHMRLHTKHNLNQIV
ncbi:uncharacterized protein LOC142995614 [Genypterus blacodes]|uniref:uncharacterized protein LOC142995614 n=1 Tax=Genypterus blacodes TaxID=154954 RepID=UPI003F75DECE